jgi:hypothetical protein
MQVLVWFLVEFVLYRSQFIFWVVGSLDPLTELGFQLKHSPSLGPRKSVEVYIVSVPIFAIYTRRHRPQQALGPEVTGYSDIKVAMGERHLPGRTLLRFGGPRNRLRRRSSGKGLVVSHSHRVRVCQPWLLSSAWLLTSRSTFLSSFAAQ